MAAYGRVNLLYISNQVRALERNRKMSLGLPIQKLKYPLPFGYKVDPTDPNTYIVDEEEYALLVQAREYLKSCSYNEVSAWIKSKGKTLGHSSLFHIMKTRPPYTEDERRIYTQIQETDTQRDNRKSN